MDLGIIFNAASTIAVVAGVVFAGWQLRLAAHARASEMSLRMMESLRSPEFVRGLVLLTDAPDGLNRAQMRKRAGANWDEVLLTLATVDALGLMVYRKMFSAQLAEDFFRHTITLVWEKMRGTVEDYRTDMASPTPFEFLQWLADRHSCRNDDPNRKPVYLA